MCVRDLFSFDSDSPIVLSARYIFPVFVLMANLIFHRFSYLTSDKWRHQLDTFWKGICCFFSPTSIVRLLQFFPHTSIQKGVEIQIQIEWNLKSFSFNVWQARVNIFRTFIRGREKSMCANFTPDNFFCEARKSRFSTEKRAFPTENAMMMRLALFNWIIDWLEKSWPI